MEKQLHPPDEPFEPLPEARQALLDRFKQYAVWHPRLVQVQTQLLDTIWEPADVVYVVVCGPSGVGKSKLAEVLTKRLNTPKSDANGHALRRALLVNTRPPDGELFHRTNFYQQGLRLLGKNTIERQIQVDVITAEHLIEKKRPRGRVPAYPDNPEVRDAYEQELRRQRLYTVILDEAQHLIQSGDGKQPKDQLNWIKSMATETGVLHVLIGTYDLLPFCNLDGQMARRGSEIHFARYHMEDEKDCQAFCNALLSLLKQIPLTIDHDALMQRWWYFFEGSIGCIGILKQWLVRALYRALREASTELTRTHLEQSVLPDAKWERMRADARSGEAEFQYAGEPGSYLSDLASLPAFVPGQPASPQEPRPQLGGRGAGATGKRDAHKSKSRPGEPAPRRDQVGKASDEQAPPRCSFSGPIELEAARWLESTVEVVQCPTCGSVSKARLKESSVMIAPHPPRTSRPVRNVTRWTEQGPDWVLVQKKE
jgi:energy-coupling factor transporter ATP-binding protein EcfA2